MKFPPRANRKLIFGCMFLSLALLGCRKTGKTVAAARTSDVSAIQLRAAVEYFEHASGVLAQKQSEYEPDDFQYRQQAYADAIRMLKGLPQTPTNFPYPVMGFFLRQQDGITILWLEPGFDVSGIQLADEDGPLGDGDCIHLSPSKRKGLAETLVRTAGVGVVENGRVDSDAELPPDVIRLRRPAGNKITLKLRTAQGITSRSIPLFAGDERSRGKEE